MTNLFPIMLERGQKAYVPWGIAEACRAQLLKNHDQTVERLAERGGLDPRELASALVGRWFDTSMTAQQAWGVIWRAWEPISGELVSCYDCKRPYGDEHGFPDLCVPDDVWRRISPLGDPTGLLCPSCICKRAHQLGIRCEAVFRSGPFCLNP